MHGFFLGFIGLIIVVGTGSIWFFFNLYRRKRVLKNLLSLPKERRFFWYRLKKEGYKIQDLNKIKKFTVYINEEEETSFLKLDFLVKKDGKKLGGIFIPDCINHKDIIKLCFVYSSVFNLKGLICYNEFEKSLIKVEI